MKGVNPDAMDKNMVGLKATKGEYIRHVRGNRF